MSNEMQKGLQVFSFEERQTRITTIKGVLWLVAKDVAGALGYAGNSNPARLFQAVPEEWKSIKRIDTPGGEQKMLCLSEQGLYFFLGRSDKPKALPYQKWIAGEVVPTIRKTGLFATLPMTNRAGDVFQIGGEMFVSTIDVAKAFQKDHHIVVSDFQKAMEEIRSILITSSETSYILEPDIYIDKHGRTQACYRANRSLFNYVALNYPGDETRLCRMRFIEQFEAMDRSIKVQLSKQMLYQKEGDQAVYVIKNEQTGMVKVGVAKDPEARMNTLANQSGCDLQMVYCTPKCKNAYEIEQNIHKVLGDYRCRGEWFDVPESDVVDSLRGLGLNFGSGFLGLEALV